MNSNEIDGPDELMAKSDGMADIRKLMIEMAPKKTPWPESRFGSLGLATLTVCSLLVGISLGWLFASSGPVSTPEFEQLTREFSRKVGVSPIDLRRKILDSLAAD